MTKHVLAYSFGDVEFEVPDGSTFTGVCATCRRCDGPLPIVRAVDREGRPSFWATCPKCKDQYLVMGLDGPNGNPVFSMIPYHHNPSASRTWMGLDRKNYS